MITRGRYIVIEGNDGTGKSTQVRLLQTYFHEQGRSVVTIEEPGAAQRLRRLPRVICARLSKTDGCSAIQKLI